MHNFNLQIRHIKDTSNSIADTLFEKADNCDIPTKELIIAKIILRPAKKIIELLRNLQQTQINQFIKKQNSANFMVKYVIYNNILVEKVGKNKKYKASVPSILIKLTLVTCISVFGKRLSYCC